MEGFRKQLKLIDILKRQKVTVCGSLCIFVGFCCVCVCVRGIAVQRLSEVVCMLLASFCGPRLNAITFAAVLLYCTVIEFVVYVSGGCIMSAGAFGSCETAGLHGG
jgi:hypothetical protein